VTVFSQSQFNQQMSYLPTGVWFNRCYC